MIKYHNMCGVLNEVIAYAVNKMKQLVTKRISTFKCQSLRFDTLTPLHCTFLLFYVILLCVLKVRAMLNYRSLQQQSLQAIPFFFFLEWLHKDFEPNPHSTKEPTN